jgi:hypothetical protein
MEGWLRDFERLGLVRWRGSTLELVRLPTASEICALRVE